MLFTIMGIVVVTAISVVGLLLYLLNKEGRKEVIEAAVPVFTAPIQPQPSAAEEAYKKRAEALEDELRQVSDKALSQAQEALSMIDELKSQNETIEEEKRRLQVEHESKRAEAGEHLTQLRQDNNVLQVQLDGSRAKIAALEDEIVAIKKQMEVEITRANAQLEQVIKEKEEAVTDGVNYQIAALKADHEALAQANLDMQKTNQKLKEFNSALVEKNDILQYEMIKNRAQASGLERMCENYKAQIEQFGELAGRSAVGLLKA